MDPYGSDLRILSRPVKVHWAGWETDTYRLQQAGWSLSAVEDVCRRQMRLAIENTQVGVRGYTGPVDWDYYAVRGLDKYGDWVPETGCQMHMGKTVMIHEHGAFDLSERFEAIDAFPQMLHERVSKIEDLAHFAKSPIVRTQAIVLPEPDVAELLGRILEKQAKAKTDYFKDVVAREGSLLVPHKFHAQIISLDDVREAA